MQKLFIAVVAVMLLSGVFIHNSRGNTFLEPSFGGRTHFHNSALLWRLAGVFTTLPTLGIAATAIVALLLAQRNARKRAV